MWESVREELATAVALGPLVEVDLGNTRVEGGLPNEIGELSKLEDLRAPQSKLLGRLRFQAGGLAGLKNLILTSPRGLRVMRF